MAESRRVGSPTSFWNNTSAGTSSTSTEVRLPHWTNKLALYITAGGSTVVTLQAAHHGLLDSEGTEPGDEIDAGWAAVQWLGTPVTYTFTGASSAVILVPDFVPQYVRLALTTARTMTAGHEAIGS